jgi:hypothetical protein
MSSRIQLVVAGILISFLLLLDLARPASPWIYFGIIWLIPIGLALVDLTLPSAYRRSRR